MKIPAIIALALFSSCTAAFAGPASDKASTAAKDTKFLKTANQGSVNEIELAQTVLKKTDNPDVKAFAQKMVEDHGKLIEDMKPFDAEAGLEIPKHPDAATEAQKLKFTVLSGDTLDKAYIKAMVEDHHKDLQEFIAEQKATGYPEFRTAVSKGEKVIREHLTMINEIAQKNGLKPAPVPASGE